jgi:D-inositol-3-phosphate glycosyltransferase
VRDAGRRRRRPRARGRRRGGGTLVPGHDPADHAAAAVRYLTDPAAAGRASSAAGIETARSATWERTVDRLLDVYGGLLAAEAEPEVRRGA